MTRIRVNVFDLAPDLNKILRCAKIGVYHTSIVIDESSEYYYGYAMLGVTGIDSPEVIDELPSIMRGAKYTTVDVGTSNLDPMECQKVVNDFKLSERYMSEQYNLLLHNCNTFTYEMCLALLGEKQTRKKYPHWVRRGQNIGRMVFAISLAPIIALSGMDMPGFSLLDHGPMVGQEKKVSRETDDLEIQEVELHEIEEP